MGYEIRQAIRWLKRKWHMITQGFDPADTWSLDVSLAKWLIPRLRYLADSTQGAPHGYPAVLPQTPQDSQHPLFDTWVSLDTDFDAWKDDIRSAATRLENWINYTDGGIQWNYEREIELEKEAEDAFGWVFKNIRSLWW